MKTEITLQRYTVEKLIEAHEALAKQMETPNFREYFNGKRSAFEDLLILFREDRSLTDIYIESFTPSDER